MRLLIENYFFLFILTGKMLLFFPVFMGVLPWCLLKKRWLIFFRLYFLIYLFIFCGNKLCIKFPSRSCLRMIALLIIWLQDLDMTRGEPLYLNEDRYKALAYMVSIFKLQYTFVKYYASQMSIQIQHTLTWPSMRYMNCCKRSRGLMMVCMCVCFLKGL